MDKKSDRIITVVFLIDLIVPFVIPLLQIANCMELVPIFNSIFDFLSSKAWALLRAVGFLDPSYVTGEDKTIYWAIATFSFMGLLLALFVPKVSEFDRQLTKEMGVTDAKIKPSTWRCVLFRLYKKQPYSRKWVLDSFLSSQRYFIILCGLGAAFIVFPPLWGLQLRGLWIILTLIYSYFMLLSMESLSNVDQYETLLLNNIKDKEVKPLLEKYVENVYSTQGHPRQEAFYQELDHGENGFYTLIQEKRFEEYVLRKQLNEEIIRNFLIHKITIPPVLTVLMGSWGLYPFSNVHTGYEAHFYRKDVINAWFSYFKNLLILGKDNTELREHILSNLESTLRPSRKMSRSNRCDDLFFKYNTHFEPVASIPNLTLEVLPYSSQSASSACLVFSEKYVNGEISAYYFELTAGLFTIGLLYEMQEALRLRKFLECLCKESPDPLLLALLIVASGCYIYGNRGGRGGDSFFGPSITGERVATGWVNKNIEHPQIGMTLLSFMAFNSTNPEYFARQVKGLIEVYPYLKDIFITTISDNAWLLKNLEIFRKELSNQNLLNMDINFYKKYRTNQSKYPKRFSPLNFIEYQRYNCFECENPISIRDYLQTHFLGILEEYCQEKHPKTKYFRRFKRLFEKIPTAFWEASCFDQTFTTIVYEYKPAIFTAENLKGLDEQLLRDIFPNDEDTKTILNKWEAFHIKLKSLYEEEGWVSST